ncbi:MAG: hypothetical protein EYC68_08370 [Chloroflexota bacterium]|nr:MAG: hypothetical protein EYC68_08370 [Chloroflexota bacterium]
MSTEEARMDPAAGPTPEPTTTTETPGSAKTNTETSDANLADELREFGKQIEGLFQTARTSSRGKDIETQLTSAWRDVEKGVNNAINKAQSSDLSGTVQGTARYAADEAQTGLARGLRGLNQWLAQKKSNVEEKRKAREGTDAGASQGTKDPVADRYDNDQPVFGQDVHVPAAHVEVKSDPNALNRDNPIADRFGDSTITFGGSDEVK